MHMNASIVTRAAPTDPAGSLLGPDEMSRPGSACEPLLPTAVCVLAECRSCAPEETSAGTDMGQRGMSGHVENVQASM